MIESSSKCDVTILLQQLDFIVDEKKNTYLASLTRESTKMKSGCRLGTNFALLIHLK
jgi:hypothetical protein